MTLLKTVGAGPEVAKLFLAVSLLVAGEMVTKLKEISVEGAGSELQFRKLVAISEGNDLYCTEEVKQCADGSYVARDSKNNCKFRACPGESGRSFR